MTVILGTSCRKYVEVGPPIVELTSETVFNNDATATAALLGIYSGLEDANLLYNLTLYPALSSDEAVVHSSSQSVLDFATNSLTPENSTINNLWSNLYNQIYKCNATLDALEYSNGVTESVRQQLKGEALFLRAYFYFYLTNLYGDIPLVLSSDYTISSTVGQSNTNDVYNQIKKDLLTAKSLLAEDYLDGSNKPSAERLRANKWAASALLAKLYLHQLDYYNAEVESKALINVSTFQLVDNLDQVFLKNSKEAVWQVQPPSPRNSTSNGHYFILTSRPSTSSVSGDLYQSMDSIDKRRNHWIQSIVSSGQTYYYPYKYRNQGNVVVATEYTMMLRLAEVYLILAESQILQDKLPEGAFSLNLIRSRAGLSPTTAVTREELLDAVYRERRFEMMFEMGTRWIDLKRSGRASEVLAPLKGSNWSEDDKLYPIPESEIIKNPLLTQNKGY